MAGNTNTNDAKNKNKRKEIKREGKDDSREDDYKRRSRGRKFFDYKKESKKDTMTEK